jgi:hypothetical protein
MQVEALQTEGKYLVWEKENCNLLILTNAFCFMRNFFYSLALLMYGNFVNSIRGSMTQNFRHQVFFMDQFPPGPRVSHSGHFKFFLREFAEIFATLCL